MGISWILTKVIHELKADRIALLYSVKIFCCGECCLLEETLKHKLNGWVLFYKQLLSSCSLRMFIHRERAFKNLFFPLMLSLSETVHYMYLPGFCTYWVTAFLLITIVGLIAKQLSFVLKYICPLWKHHTFPSNRGKEGGNVKKKGKNKNRRINSHTHHNANTSKSNLDNNWIQNPIWSKFQAPHFGKGINKLECVPRGDPSRWQGAWKEKNVRNDGRHWVCLA